MSKTNEELNKKIQEAIKDSLPASLGDALRERLNSLETVEEDLKRANDTIEDKNKIVSRLQKENLAINTDLDKANEALKIFAIREEAINRSEMKIALNNQEVEMNRRHTDDIKSIVQSVFRNSTVRKTIHETHSSNGGEYDNTTNSNKTTSHSEDRNITTTEDEE